MAQRRDFWLASVTTLAGSGERLIPALETGSVSLTVVAPPRRAEETVEALFDHPPNRADLLSRLDILASLNGIPAPRITIAPLGDLDWLKKVAEDFPPLPIARWVVFGAQHRHAARRHRGIGLQIDATSAFGTGEHPTTRGCLLMLDEALKGKRRPRAMLDMGCGTAILAMAYAKAARRPAFGIDIDADSVAIARANAASNGLRSFVRILKGNGYRSAPLFRRASFDLIMANIFAGPLCHMARDLKRYLAPGGTAILSGILRSQANRVIAAHRLQGLHLAQRQDFGEWSVLALRSPSRTQSSHD